MKFKNTENQQKIIDHRNGNILVSAGAGSGKTTVLTSHIIDRLNDKDNPIDIDRLLIVTFTKAAAAEMKERISAKVKDRRSKALLNHAHISTIDSFCSWVVKNNFEITDLDPNYKMASEGELALIKHEIFDELMEERYLLADESFFSFLDSYTGGKNDENIFSIVDSLYNKAMSTSDPEAYFSNIKNMSITSGDVYSLHPLIIYSDKVVAETSRVLKDYESYEVYTCDKYKEDYINDITFINLIRDCKNLKELSLCLNNTAPRMFKNRMKPYSDNDLIYKEYRDGINEYLKDLRSKTRQLVDFENTYKETIPYLEIIIELSLEYYYRVQAEKRERNLVDFSDIEHYALEILKSSDSIADGIRDSFDEILIDEYQDSNDLQEAIFNTISTGSNMFMVGDIKQSIYGFRNATPSLFKERYSSYKEKSLGTAIDLSENFRCRKEVVDSVNEIIDVIMSTDIGGSDYKHTSRLLQFASYEEPEDEDMYKSELVVIKSNYGANFRTNIEVDYVAQKIKDLIASEMPVFDKEQGISRPIMYKDIAIIMRNIKKPIEVYSSKFNAHDIPAITTRSTGYFDSAEVKLILNALSIIDNPRQDIPLAGVMLSPMVGFTNDELAIIRNEYKPSSKAGVYNDFYDALLASSSEKVKDFLSKLNRYRNKALSHTILDLINIILKESGYEYYVKSLKGGENRLANIDMLKEYAKEYEKTTYSGIYDFCRYISNIKKRNIDFEQANTLSNAENVVRIMSIHASKGLEYPVVFLTGLSNKFNLDNKSEISVNSDYGVALSCKNASKSIKVKNFLKEVINDFNREDYVSEEMRLLYVAMTRAREKLILVASEKGESKYQNLVDGFDNKLIPSSNVKRANSMHDFIMMAMPSAGFSSITTTYVNPSEDMKTVHKIEYPSSTKLEDFNEGLLNETKRILDLDFVYQNNAATRVKGSYSISEINDYVKSRLNDGDSTEYRHSIYNAGSTSAKIGSAYHAVFEMVDIKRASDTDHVNAVIKTLIDNNVIDEDTQKRIVPEKITALFDSDIGKDILTAYNNGKLYRERAFVLGVPAYEFDEACTDDELTIVQGVIDLYYEDDNGIVLVDYKSNYVEEGGESALIEKYLTQINLYARALEAETGKKVYKKFLYSIHLNKFIEVK